MSTTTRGREPTARVMMFFRGWVRASASVIRPSRSSSPTNEWSRVTCLSSPARSM
jgi:hypothetical protein